MGNIMGPFCPLWPCLCITITYRVTKTESINSIFQQQQKNTHREKARDSDCEVRAGTGDKKLSHLQTSRNTVKVQLDMPGLGVQADHSENSAVLV